MSQFTIPEKYASSLRPVPVKDTRSDSEILTSLTQHVPVVSEKNIWTYWHAGILAMPAWCQRNIIGWIRLHGSSWTVRVLDTVPGSPNNALDWIDADTLPKAFVKGTMTGPYVGPHSADFLRGAALYTYGGVWMDVGCILFRDLDRACWNDLADEETEHTICVPWMFGQYTANHFVAARKGDEFIMKWHTLFIHLWQDSNDFKGVITSPLISFLSSLDFSERTAAGFDWKFKVDDATTLGYVGQCIAWIRVSLLREPASTDGTAGFDGVSYWNRKILLLDSSKENWAAERIVGYRGEDLFRVFTTRRDGMGVSEEEFELAERTAWSLLASSTMQKITHGKDLTYDTHCGVLLDLLENQGKDAGEGTFGELLRYGSVHLEQTRNEVAIAEPPVVKEELVIDKGLLEP